MSPSGPLLHIVDSAAGFATVDIRLVALGFALLAAALAALWIPRSALRPARALRRKAAAVALSLLVLAAVIPTVFPYDHVFATGHEPTHGAAVHVDHCHLNPGGCADTPVSSGPGQFIQSSPLIITPALLSILLVLSIPALTGIVHRPELRPPLLPITA